MEVEPSEVTLADLQNPVEQLKLCNQLEGKQIDLKPCADNRQGYILLIAMRCKQVFLTTIYVLLYLKYSRDEKLLKSLLGSGEKFV